MVKENGGGAGSSDERLAPVIPLFGSRASASTDSASTNPTKSDPAKPDTAKTDTVKTDTAKTDSVLTFAKSAGVESAATTSASTVSRPESGSALGEHHPAGRMRSAAEAAQSSAPRLRALRDDVHSAETEDTGVDPEELQQKAAESLVRKLRARALSVSEARMVLRGHQLPATQIDDILDDFQRRGYLDDATLAEQLVESGVQRKGQGRVALSRALAQRGIPRDVVDTALDELPDDDAERALDFARSKARSLSRLDNDTALRRLMGQLARRGYGGSVAMSAAKTALAEAGSGGRPTGVRFVDSD